jgi:hypothetical protein
MLSINPGLYGSKLPYDPQKDFVPVSMVATMLLVSASEKTADNLYINNVRNKIFAIIISVKIIS